MKIECIVVTQPLTTYHQLAEGALFTTETGTTVYIKTDEQSAVTLSNGELHHSWSAGGVVIDVTDQWVLKHEN